MESMWQPGTITTLLRGSSVRTRILAPRSTAVFAVAFCPAFLATGCATAFFALAVVFLTAVFLALVFFCGFCCSVACSAIGVFLSMNHRLL
ncbi:putative membrane protein [Mycobacterium kansasii]|uniref:Putative membrane protein n=1 Tax=Mycobacterium kansasii TaxID=1768 RepID=A0A1V3WGC9_MYCKA|nr:putative membrane protein [Mycobacterium kansasii]